MKLIRRNIGSHTINHHKTTPQDHVYLFYERTSGAAHFKVDAGPDGELPVDHAAGLLAMHCLIRGQSPDDYLVMVPAAPDRLTGVTERAQQLLEAGRQLKSTVRLTRREEEVLDRVLRSLANKEIALAAGEIQSPQPHGTDAGCALQLQQANPGGHRQPGTNISSLTRTSV